MKIKKVVLSTVAATALMALPFVGNADAAERTDQSQAKVFYINGDLSNQSNWCNYVFKFDWNQSNKDHYTHKDQNQKQETNKNEQNTEQNTTQTPPKVEQPEQQPSKPVQKPSEPQNNEQVTESNNALNEFEQQVVDLTNQERAKNGLAPLKVDATLSKVAREKSRDMSANHYFDHNSPTYGSPFDMMKQYGVSYRSAGENIAMGQRSPQEVVNGWMNSPGHRANILNSSYTHIGVGYISNGNYWTQEFIGK
ncbi:CAP domain-containing protein [Lederbergia sp. NSJ-179]|uniref:CAP domain-containing protein n=1 Tax=Lederbergia sp. NSJ-179 TaxID=2931402 RepID=UPI001FD3C0A7|nr:CAP domain-containing protein [Lederbergia sp. NSJ-179]MCJ7841152.1 CAP domain-containing protein [Lederbergia sp. NSJ-179]